MNWDQLEENMKEFINNVKDQWVWFLDDQIEVLEGKRSHLCGKMQKFCVVDNDDAEKRLADWQKLQRDKNCNY